MNVTVKGIGSTLKYIEQQAKNADAAVNRGVVATAGQIQRTAVLSINESTPGEIGYSSVRKGKTHIKSSEGNAPNADSGTLSRSVTIFKDPTRKEATVFSDLDYGAYLEFVLNRPWLEPALDKNAGNLRENIDNQLRKDIE